MAQQITDIKVSELCLWTENPRDPIDTKSTDYDIIKRAIDENSKDWNLDNLVKAMGDHYDFSELPTVVYIDSKPIVYDGNRRITVLKYLQNKDLYSSLSGKLFLDDGPEELRGLTEIPCNVCDKETALQNIERKHANSGSWSALQQDYFRHLHRGEPKSLFILIEEKTGLIRSHPKLNQGFVKKEILTESNLNSIGLGLMNGAIVSNYQDQKTVDSILEQVVSVINNNKINTRDNRGQLRKTLVEQNDEIENTLATFDNTKTVTPVDNSSVLEDVQKTERRTRVTKSPQSIFGKKLILQKGTVNDLYCGISDIYEKVGGQDNTLPIIAMSLRLLLDTAARSYYIGQGETGKAEKDAAYKDFLKIAKKELSKQRQNSLALNNDWLSDERNLDAVLGKYAHGNITYKRGDILKDSIIVADIVEHYFKKQTK